MAKALIVFSQWAGRTVDFKGRFKFVLGGFCNKYIAKSCHYRESPLFLAYIRYFRIITAFLPLYHYVDTAGKNAKKVEAYIRNQIQEDAKNDQISLCEYMNSFAGEPVKKGGS